MSKFLIIGVSILAFQSETPLLHRLLVIENICSFQSLDVATTDRRFSERVRMSIKEILMFSFVEFNIFDSCWNLQIFIDFSAPVWYNIVATQNVTVKIKIWIIILFVSKVRCLVSWTLHIFITSWINNQGSVMLWVPILKVIWFQSWFLINVVLVCVTT